MPRSKITKSTADDYAEQWSGAYRADYNGREVSIRLIQALFAAGYPEKQAEAIYRSKQLRWFFDSQGDRVAVAEAHALFTKHLKRNKAHIQAMFEQELPELLKT